MNSKTKSEVKVGITVFFGLIIFIWIFGWAKNINLSGEEIFIKIKFNSVAGLGVGDPVTLNGVKTGSVENINIDGNSVLVEAKLNSEIEISEDSKFLVLMLDLMGGKKIEITPGVSQNPIDFSKTQQGYFGGDIGAVMASLNSVQQDIIDLMYSVKSSVESINKILTKESTQTNIESSIANLEKITSNLNDFIESEKQNLSKIIDNTETLTSSVSSILDSNQKSINTSIQNFELLLNNSNELIVKLSNYSDKFTDDNNNLNQILNDKELLKNLKLTLEQTKELTRILVEQLKGEGVNVDANIF